MSDKFVVYLGDSFHVPSYNCSYVMTIQPEDKEGFHMWTPTCYFIFYKHITEKKSGIYPRSVAV
jgi:hypothetical protein